jgi:hypothetical protein
VLATCQLPKIAAFRGWKFDKEDSCKNPRRILRSAGMRRKGEGEMAKYLMSWKTRAAGTAQQNHDDGKSILEAFAKWQIPADQNYKEFLSRVDGEGGFAVIETDNQAGLLDGVSKFLTWLEFDIVPVVDIMDAVSVLSAGADYRESI